jgi:hypothetical protein
MTIPEAFEVLFEVKHDGVRALAIVDGATRKRGILSKLP